jgi:hypothetical protein
MGENNVIDICFNNSRKSFGEEKLKKRCMGISWASQRASVNTPFYTVGCAGIKSDVN